MSRRVLRVWSLLACLAGGLFVCSSSLRAQGLVLAGRVLGPNGEPVPDQALLLHRVTDAGGTMLAHGNSDAEGRFTLRAEQEPATGGVYFVATRYEGQLYIGPLLKPPFPDSSEYIVQVGVAGVGDVSALTGATRAQPGAPASPPSPATSPVFALMLLATALSVGAYLRLRGVGPSRRRRALIGLAEIAEREETGTDGKRVDDRGREELLRRAAESAP